MTDVTTQRAEYTAALPSWTLAEDAAAGEAAVKAAKDKYLPRPNPTDTSAQNEARYDQYLLRAVYYNATGRTLSGLIGIAFARWPEIDLPAGMEFAEKDIAGANLSLIQQAQAAVAQVLKTGRAGLLTDYPPTTGTVSRADQERGGVRPTITLYRAADIINWRTERKGGVTRLSMVVLVESFDEVIDFAISRETQYRVVKLEGGIVRHEIYRATRGNDGKITWARIDEYEPRRGDGRPWTEIPFTFIGARNNDWEIDPAPLYDLATINLAHYRNSADYEDSAYFVGQPQYWVAGLDEAWRDDMYARGVYVGSRAILALPANGSAGILQAQPNTLAGEAMKDKEAQMAALGARLIVGSVGNKTARQQDSEDTVAHSVLSLVCDNVSAAYRQALTWFAAFNSTEPADGDIEFEIPTDFASREMDPAELTALLAAVQAGKMPESDLWTRLRNAGLIDSTKSDDDIREEIDSQRPPGGGTLTDPEADPVPGDDNDKGKAGERRPADDEGE